MKCRQIYAVYKGEQNLADGTAKELAKQFGVTEKTVRYWATPTHNKRNKGSRLVAIKLDKEQIE